VLTLRPTISKRSVTNLAEIAALTRAHRAELPLRTAASGMCPTVRDMDILLIAGLWLPRVDLG